MQKLALIKKEFKSPVKLLALPPRHVEMGDDFTKFRRHQHSSQSIKMEYHLQYRQPMALH